MLNASTKASRFAAELARVNIDIFLIGNSALLHAAQQANNGIPIVVAEMTDPVG
jgi:hypothetical protein